jgi:hypothetical protein
VCVTVLRLSEDAARIVSKKCLSPSRWVGNGAAGGVQCVKAKGRELPVREVLLYGRIRVVPARMQSERRSAHWQGGYTAALQVQVL